MANTTNFGWETPDDTDLVKDGALAIRTLGSAIDTSLVDLKGGTSGQVLSKNSNTDMDFVWVTSDDANAIQNAIVDAKGDLITATAADTPARLAVGTNERRLVADSGETTGLKWVADTTNYAIAAKGDLLVGTGADTLTNVGVGTNDQVLVADSSTASGVKWASAGGGSLTKVYSSSFTSVSSFNINNVFSSTYDNYVIHIRATVSAAGNLDFRLRLSGTDSTASYGRQVHYGQGATSASFKETGQGFFRATGDANGGVYNLQLFSPGLAEDTGFLCQAGIALGTPDVVQNIFGVHDVATAYDGLTLLVASGTMTGKVKIYGYTN